MGVASGAGSEVDIESLPRGEVGVGGILLRGDRADAGDFDRSGLSSKIFQSSPESTL